MMHRTLDWLSNLDHELLEQEGLEERARLLLLDTLACAASGMSAPEVRHLAETMAHRTPGPIRLPGLSGGVGVLEGSFLLTMAACWDEACEGLARAHGRPGLHAVPAAAVLGSGAQATLRQVLSALIWGYEVGGRAGEAMRIEPGLHVDGSWGAIGSAAAAARVMGLELPMIKTAVAIAASQISMGIFLPVHQGRTSRNTYAAMGTQHGIWSASAAEAGVTAPEGAFATSRDLGFLKQPELPAQMKKPSGFFLLEGYLKPFAGARHVHYPAAGALRYRAQHGAPSPGDIEEIRIRLYPEALRYCGNRAPNTAIQAQFSVTWGAAFALLKGGLGPEAYHDENLADPEIRNLESRIVTEETDQFTHRGCEVQVKTAAGWHHVTVEEISGDPERPLTRREVQTKARRYLSPTLTRNAAEKLITTILQGDLDTPFRLQW
jgi:2-methylcitrate dehydratase PrpD